MLCISLFAPLSLALLTMYRLVFIRKPIVMWHMCFESYLRALGLFECFVFHSNIPTSFAKLESRVCRSNPLMRSERCFSILVMSNLDFVVQDLASGDRPCPLRS